MLRYIKYFSYVMIIFGSVNWGAIGFFDLDIVAFLFGEMSTISRIIYSIIGICGVAHAFITYNDNDEDC